MSPTADRVYVLHVDAWATGGSLEDIPERDRDPELWETVSEYGPIFLGLVREGVLDGYEELLEAGVDFSRATDAGAGSVGGRRNHAPAHNTPRQP